MKKNIKLTNLTKQFNNHTILHAICAEFQQGNTYAITGVSGSGKSTLMHLLAGLDVPNEGQIFFDGRDINAMNADQKNSYRNESIGLVFQKPYVIRELSVLENVMMPALITQKDKKTVLDDAHHLLQSVGLKEYANRETMALSGGQLQRIALARALINKPSFLLADEPTGSLDAQTGAQIVDVLLQLQREWGMGIIVSTHDAYVADAMRVRLKIDGGKIIKS